MYVIQLLGTNFQKYNRDAVMFKYFTILLLNYLCGQAYVCTKDNNTLYRCKAAVRRILPTETS